MSDDLLDRRLRQLMAEVHESAPPAAPWETLERQRIEPELKSRTRWWPMLAVAAAIAALVATAIVTVDEDHDQVRSIQPTSPTEIRPTTNEPTTSPGSVDEHGDGVDTQGVTTARTNPLISEPTAAQIVALTPDGDFVRIELGTGNVTTVDISQVRAGGADAVIVPGDGRTLVAAQHANWRAFVVEDGGAVRSGDWLDALFAGDEPGSLWLARREGDRVVGVGVADFNGSPAAASVQLSKNQIPVARDPTGGVVVFDYVSSQSFVVGRDGIRPLADGFVWAIGVNHLVVQHDCVDPGTCQFTLVDRATQDAAPFVLPDDLEPAPDSSNFDPLSIAPDGRAIDVCVKFIAADGSWYGSRRLYVDLASGKTVPLGHCEQFDDHFWTADGRYVVVLSAGRLVVIDRVNDTLLPDDSRRPSVTHFGAVEAT